MKRVLLATAACCVLAACQQQESGRNETANEAAPAAGEASARLDAAPSTAAPQSADSARTPPPISERPGVGVSEAEAPQVPELAYAYRYALEAPEARVAGLMRRHERACVLAGPLTCQLMGAETAIDEESGKTGGELRLRAVPRWIEEFRDQLDEDAADVEGRVLQAETSTDDLTQSMGDNQAVAVRLRAERDRMRTLLRASRGSLEQRQELERELEDAQARLDEQTRVVGAETARVVMATMSVSYRAAEGAPASGEFAPVAEASRGFMGTVGAMLGGVITLASVLLVPGVIIGGIVGAVVWIKRRVRRRSAAAASAA